MALNILDESNRIALMKYMLVNFWKKPETVPFCSALEESS